MSAVADDLARAAGPGSSPELRQQDPGQFGQIRRTISTHGGSLDLRGRNIRSYRNPNWTPDPRRRAAEEPGASWGRTSIGAGVVFALAACRSDPWASNHHSEPDGRSQQLALTDLPGWGEEDHVAALKAVRSACSVSHDPALPFACASLPASADERTAQAWLERNFFAVPLAGQGRLTGYFMPVYEARRRQSETFSAPVRPKPEDLPPSDLTVGGRTAYADRSRIEERPGSDALAWMRPEDLFFMQVQGAGVLAFADGDRAKAVFDGSNGAPFVGIAQPMRAQGLISDSRFLS